MRILPGKMYEYIALRRPIIALGPKEADLAKIINDTNSGVVHDFNDARGIKDSVERYFKLFQKNKLEIESGLYEKYSLRNLAKEFVNLIEVH